MVIENNILRDKELADDAESIADAITDYMVDKGKVKEISFVLFLVDHTTGRVKYVSDLPRESSLTMLNFWVKQGTQ